MAKDHTPATPAVHALRAAGAQFTPRLYKYKDHGGAAEAARQLGVDEHAVIKTLVFADSDGNHLLMLMHGDREVSAKALARALGVKAVHPASQTDAQRLTGYQVGGISPFGIRQALPAYVEASVLALERILINGGKRGLLVELAPRALTELLAARPVEAGA